MRDRSNGLNGRCGDRSVETSALDSPTDRSVKKPARAPDVAPPPTRLEPHVCRHCFGRLVSRQAGDAREFECTNCGASVVGPSVDALCACGHPAPVGVFSGLLRCAPNPNPTPEFPSLFVAVPAAS